MNIRIIKPNLIRNCNSNSGKRFGMNDFLIFVSSELTGFVFRDDWSVVD